MNRPLVLWALIFCLGIIFAEKIIIPLFIFYCLEAIFLLLCCFSLKKKLTFYIYLACLAFCLGAINLKNSYILPRCHIYNFVSYKNNLAYTVRGLINSQPYFKNSKTSFVFRVQSLKAGNSTYNSRGNILVYIKGKHNLDYGDELIIKGSLYRLRRLRHGFTDYLRRQNIFCLMQVSSPLMLERLNINRGNLLTAFTLKLKRKIEKIIFLSLPNITAGVLSAMILGERGHLPAYLNNSLVKTGTVHILVVSGFNVGIVAFMLVIILKLLRIPLKARLCLAIFCLIVYCILTGASTPVVRATIMAGVFMAAALLKREPDIYNSFSLAGVFILLINPKQIFDTGFQLSFASVFAIICLYPKIKSLLRVESLKIKFIRFILEGLFVSLSAWIGTAGFIAYNFKLFSAVTVLANLFIVPLAALITLSGFSLLFISLVLPATSPLFAAACQLLVALLVKINALFCGIPFAYLYLK